jgi:hypothetical protein
LDDDDSRPVSADTPALNGADVPIVPNGKELRAKPDNPDLPRETRDRATYSADLRAEAQAEYRAYAIERGCERVRETEETVVTPAIRRIEAEDPDRHLVGLEFRLKGKDRLTEKVTFDMQKKGINAAEAFANVKDAIRYTFQYPDDKYSQGVRADIERLKAEGFELAEFRNTWTNPEYKGINSRWRVPGNGQLFEVQFHTQASFEAKQETHTAYEKLRTGVPKDEQRALEDFQREVSARIPAPPGAPEVSLP